MCTSVTGLNKSYHLWGVLTILHTHFLTERGEQLLGQGFGAGLPEHIAPASGAKSFNVQTARNL
jgi:hypothetical protein